LSRKIGNKAEDKAVEFLQDLDFVILERNFYSKFGEIDIIALKDDVLHFVEVKSGKGEPVYNITPAKMSKIVKTSQFYLNKTKLTFDYCYDGLIVKENSIDFIENISFY